MASLKAVLVQDYCGNNLINLLSEDTKADPTIISGLLSAIGSFSYEVLGDTLNSITCKNGLKIITDSFSVKREVIKQYLCFEKDFPFLRPIIKENNVYVTVPVVEKIYESDPKPIKHFLFAELINKLSFDSKIFTIKDGHNVYSLKYTPEIVYSVAKTSIKNQDVCYSIIYDSRDDQLDSFVENQFNKLGNTLKEHVGLIAPALFWHDTTITDKQLYPLIKEIFKQYESERQSLIGDTLFDYVSPKIVESDSNKLRENIKNALTDIINKLNN